MAKRLASEAGRDDLEFSSAGSQAWDGSPASDGSLLVGMERGLDLSLHRARMLTKEIVAGSDLILVMGPSHMDRVKGLDAAANVHLLGGFANSDGHRYAVPDPFGGDLDTYRKTANDLSRELAGLLDRIPVR